MTRCLEPMAKPFPHPSNVISSILDELRLASVLKPESRQEQLEVSMLPRPWDPASCPSDLRGLIYTWLDEVVAWINEDLTWRVDRVIPTCWTEHPHIVHELAVVACLRWEASHAVTPTAPEAWHRHTLPLFLDRLVRRVGTTGCPPGKHQVHPGASRNTYYREGSVGRRRRRLDDEAYLPIVVYNT